MKQRAERIAKHMGRNSGVYWVAFCTASWLLLPQPIGSRGHYSLWALAWFAFIWWLTLLPRWRFLTIVTYGVMVAILTPFLMFYAWAERDYEALQAWRERREHDKALAAIEKQL